MSPESSAGLYKTHICVSCNEPATNMCNRCKSVWYCGKNCQVTHWPRHKSICVDPVKAAHDEEVRRANWVLQANQRLGGNLLIMAAHCYEDHGPGIIFVDFTKSIGEFMSGGYSFAHLTFATTLREDITVKIQEISHDTVNAVYVFENYQQSVVLRPEMSDHMAMLRKNYANPGTEWSVPLNM